jgi:hypothetical protein
LLEPNHTAQECLRGAGGNQFKAEIIEIATDTDAKTCSPKEITVLFVSLIGKSCFS